MANLKISKSIVDRAQPREADFFIWDGELKGFGLKVAKGGRKTFVCKYRAGTGRSAPTRRMTIGAFGSPWTVDQARNEVKKLLGRVANGEDPASDKQAKKKQMTMTELCAVYLAEGCSTKKPSTIATDKGRIQRHIIPLLGRKKVHDVSRNDIKRFLQDVANGKTRVNVKTGKSGRAIVTGGRGTASRTVGLLGGIMSYALDLDLIESNPVRGIKKFPDKKCNRFLTEKETISLGQAMRAAVLQGVNPAGMAIIKLLIFTGARKGEIQSLLWREVDFDKGFLRLEDSKTGQKIIPLNAGALEILTELPKFKNSDYVFPSEDGESYYVGVAKVWPKIRAVAGLNDVRLQDLRHSFASIAVSSGASLPIIGALLGHRNTSTTQRYAHLSDNPVRSATALVDRQIRSALGELKAAS